MSSNIERLSDVEQRAVRDMDKDDLLALKLCLLSTGVLGGLSLKGSFARRLAGAACTFLSAGLAIPLTVRYMDELNSPVGVEPMADGSLSET